MDRVRLNRYVRYVHGAGFWSAVVLVAGACRGAAPTDAPPGGLAGAPPTAAVIGTDALATLAAVRDAPDFPHRCSEESRAALAALSKAYPLEPAVRSVARNVMPECREQEALVAVLEARPAAERPDDERVELATLYLRHVSRFPDAEAEIKPLLDRDPDEQEYVSIYAAALYYQGRFDEAIPVVDRIWTAIMRDGNTDIMAMRADAFISAGQVDRAIRILNTVIELNPTHAFGLNLLRRAESTRGNQAAAEAIGATAEAISVLNAEQSRVMTLIQTRFRDLVAAFDAGDYDTAEAIAKELLAQAPHIGAEAQLYESLASIYKMQGEPDLERQALDEATLRNKQLALTATPPVPQP